jgi:hypothetical protein
MYQASASEQTMSLSRSNILNLCSLLYIAQMLKKEIQ